jgi:hypothetical protein
MKRFPELTKARAARSTLRSTAGAILGGALALFALAPAPDAAASRMADSDELKAAFIYSFVRYSEWPKKPEEVQIAFFGHHRLYARLSALIAGRSAKASPRYSLCDSEACLSQALAIFISRDDPLAGELDRITRLPALTISDMPGFLERGGIVEIHRRGERFVFRISLKNAIRHGIHINPEMLGYAEEVLR